MFVVVDDKIESDFDPKIYWERLEKYLIDDIVIDGELSRFSHDTIIVNLITKNDVETGILFLRQFGKDRWLCFGFEDDDVWVHVDTKRVHYPSVWNYGFIYKIKERNVEF